MADMNWGPIMRPLVKDKIAAAREKQRRKKFADFDLPSTAHEWSDDQNHAFKGMRDGLGIDALKAEQYVNRHTDPKKPSGRVNLFYPAKAPTQFEQDLNRKLTDRHKPGGMKPDDGSPVQFASQSGHVLGDGEARKPQSAPANARPLFDEAAQVGRQILYKEQAAKITENNGYKNGKPINAQRPVEEKQLYAEIRTDPLTKKWIVTAKFGDKTFEFSKVYTADEITGGMASIKAKLRSNPHAMGMERIEGVSGEYYINPKDRPEGYKVARDRAMSIRLAKDTSKAVTVASIAVPSVGLVGTAASGYVAYQEPTQENWEDFILSRFGNKLFPRRWFSKDNAERGSAILQTVKDEYDKREK